MHQARFIRKVPVADQVYSFRFEPERPIDFIPGQFIELSVRHNPTDERGEKRWFSISSAKDSAFIEITTKIDGKAPSSFKQALYELSAGSRVVISDPMGDFVVPRKNDRPIIFVLAGVGASPAHSIISSTADTTFYSFITAKKRSAMPFVDIFERDSVQTYTHETSRGDKLHLKHIRQNLPEKVWESGLFFVAGQEQFCEMIKAELASYGVADSRCFVDYFHGYHYVI